MANTEVTKLDDMVNPEVMGDMVSAKVPAKLVFTPIATVDNTLTARAGNSITLPKYKYIGPAEDVAEGVECDIDKMTTDTDSFTVKKIMKGVEITDEAVLSGYGDPIGEATNQLAKAIADKIDNDCLEALKGATLSKTSANVISYDGIVDAVDVFGEEVNSEKILIINPSQVGTLRKDDDFISADKYGAGTNVMMKGEIGYISNCHVVPSLKIAYDAENDQYHDIIVKLNNDAEAEDDAPALTIYTKRDVQLETFRKSRARKTELTIDQHYIAALTNEAKVVIATFAADTNSI